MIRPTAMMENHSTSDTPPASRARSGGRVRRAVPLVASPVDRRVEQHDVDATENQKRNLQAEVGALVARRLRVRRRAALR